MRASAIASTAAEKRWNVIRSCRRPVAGLSPAGWLVTVNVMRSLPKKRWNTAIDADVMHEWPDVCSAKLGVERSGRQLGSVVVRRLPSSNVVVIAASGRHHRYSYLLAQQPIRASALAVATSA